MNYLQIVVERNQILELCAIQYPHKLERKMVSKYLETFSTYNLHYYWHAS